MRNAVLLSVATIAAGFVVPVAPFVGIPLAGFALGWIAYRFGFGPSISLALLSSALVAVFGPSALLGLVPLDGLYVAVALLAAGPAAAWALRRYSAYTVVVFATIVTAAAFLAAPIGGAMLQATLSTWRQILEGVAAGASATDAVTIKASIGPALAELRQSWPAMLVYLTGLGVLFAVPLVSRAGRSLGIEVSRYPSLADTDLTFHLVWPTIAGFVGLAAGAVWGQAVLSAIGVNLLLIARLALVLQGLGVAASLYRRLGVGRIMSVLGLALLVSVERLVPAVSVFGIVSLVGLVDLFLNFRKLPRGQIAAATGPVG